MTGKEAWANPQMQQLVGRIIMDEQFRESFFAAVNKASISGKEGPARIQAEDVSIDLSAKQLETAQMYKKKCLEMLLQCMKDTTGDMQEAW